MIRCCMLIWGPFESNLLTNPLTSKCITKATVIENVELGMCLTASSISAEQNQLLSSKMANWACVYQHYSHLQSEASYCHRKWRIGHMFICIIPICRTKSAAVIENGELGMCLSASSTYVEQNQLLSSKLANWLCIYQHRPHLQNKFSYCHRKKKMGMCLSASSSSATVIEMAIWQSSDVRQTFVVSRLSDEPIQLSSIITE